MADPAATPTCFCGSTDFTAGPDGRLSWQDKPPRCAACGSLERHRAIRAAYQPLHDLLASRACLHFARDISIEPGWFAKYESSQFGGHNSLDVTAIDRPDATYDWLILNHVLEHVADDTAAIDELGRVATPTGVIQITIPDPANTLTTDDWGYADPKRNEHYRTYGSDFPARIRAAFAGSAIQVVAADPVTGDHEIIYLLSREGSPLETIADRLIRARYPVLRAV